MFAYPCEAPKGGTDEAEKLSDESYFCIHNLINAVDVVPPVGPGQMGFKRYGVDHYIPGSPAFEGNYADAVLNHGKTVSPASGGGIYGATTVTTYRDNDPYYIKGGNSMPSVNDRTKTAMRGQLRTIYIHLLGRLQIQSRAEVQGPRGSHIRRAVGQVRFR